MATWKKVIVSGSSANLAALQVDNLTSGQVVIGGGSSSNLSTTAINGTGNIVATSGASGVIMSGSFSGSFSGDGSNLSNVTAAFPTTAKTDLAGTDKFYINDGANKYIEYRDLITDLVGPGLAPDGDGDGLAVDSGSLSGYFATASWAGVSGDITISSAGVATIAANSVALGTDTTGNYVATIANVLNGGLTVNNSGTETAAVTLALNLNDLVGGSINVAEDKYVFIDNTDAGSKQATFSALATAQAGSGLTAVNGTFNVNSGSMLPYYSSSIFARVSGDITINSGGVAAIGTGVIVDADVNANAAISYTKLNLGGSGIVSASAFSSPSQGTLRATINGVQTDVDLALQSADSPQFVGLTLTGDLAVNGGDITTTNTAASIFNANATSLNIGGAATTISIGAATGTTTVKNKLIVSGGVELTGIPAGTDNTVLILSGSTIATDEIDSRVWGSTLIGGSLTTGRVPYATGANTVTDASTFLYNSGTSVLTVGTSTFGTNVNIAGDLTVLGTTITMNTDNLLVEDKFILMASGSTSATDGGIIVQSAAGGTGFAFGYDSPLDRWVYQDALAHNATAFGTVTAYATTTQYGLASAKPTDATGPSYGGTSGYGNIWVSTDTQDIWIYA